MALLQRLLIATLHRDLTDLPWSCVHLLQLRSLDPVVRIKSLLSCIIKRQILLSNLNLVTKGRVSSWNTGDLSVDLGLQSLKWG